MKTVKVIAPSTEDCPGSVHEIPESDLGSFLENGWEQEGEKENKKHKK